MREGNRFLKGLKKYVKGEQSLCYYDVTSVYLFSFSLLISPPSPLHNINKPTSRRGCCFSLACHRRCLSLCEKRIIKDEAREAKYLVKRSATFGRAKRHLWSREAGEAQPLVKRSDTFGDTRERKQEKRKACQYFSSLFCREERSDLRFLLHYKRSLAEREAAPSLSQSEKREKRATLQQRCRFSLRE